MKTHKCSSSFIRRAAFLLFLSMLLSVFTVFPSHALEDDGIEQALSGTVKAPLSADTPVTEEETAPYLPSEEPEMSASSVQVANNTENTSIFLSSGVDMAVNATQQLFVVTALPNADSVSILVDKPALLSIGTPTSLYEGEMYVLITAKKTGIATVTVKVKDGDEVLDTATIEIYITMDDGIYLIKNCATHLPTSLGDYYLRVGEPSAEPPTIHASTNTYGDMTNNIYRYWRIEYAGNGCYYIRPLMNENMSLYAVGSGVTVSDNTPYKWIIRYQSGGYEIIQPPIEPQNNTGMVLSTYTVQTGIYSPTLGQEYYYAIPTLVAVQDMAFERWNFIQSDISGIYFRNNTTQSIRSTISVQSLLGNGQVDLNDLGYSPVAFGYEGTLRWSSGNTAIAEVGANTGMITPKKHGAVTITISASGSQLSKSFTVTFTLNGTYFLRNLETDLYADIQNGTMSNGNEIEQQTFDGDNTQKWIFTHIGSNVYTIRSAKNTAYYLGVQNNSTTDGANIVLRTGGVTAGMKWRIEAGNEGYKIVSYSDSSMVLATYSSNSTPGQKLILGDYVDNTSYRDEWVIIEPFSLALTGVPDSGHDHLSALNHVKNLGGWNSNIVRSTTFTSVSPCKQDLQNCNIFVSRSHGHIVKDGDSSPVRAFTTGIILNNSTDMGLYGRTWTNMTSESDVILDSEDYSGLDIVVFVGCKTGFEGHNLPERMHERGAKVAIGFKNEIDCDDANTWTERFFNNLFMGKTIEEAKQTACFNLSITEDCVNIYGDTSWTLTQ